MLQDRPEYVDWTLLQAAHPDEGAKKQTDVILDLAGEWIGKRTLMERKSTHPWLTDRAEEAIAK